MTLHAYRGYKNNNTTKRNKNNYQRYWNIFKKKSTLKGPVVQSIVSLTKSLGEYPLSLSVLTKSTATIIFCWKIVRNFCSAKHGKTWLCFCGLLYLAATDPVKKLLDLVHALVGRTHGYWYVPLRFGGNVVRRMGTQQQHSLTRKWVKHGFNVPPTTRSLGYTETGPRFKVLSDRPVKWSCDPWIGSPA